MALSLQQVQKQTQRLIMTPQMQQSIQLLQMNSMDLEMLIRDEMLENPFLEMSDDEEATASGAEDAVDAPDAEPEVAELSGLSDEAAQDTLTTADDQDFDRESVVDTTNWETTEPSDPGNQSEGSEEFSNFAENDVDWGEEFADSDTVSTGSGTREEHEEHDFTTYTGASESLYDSLLRQLHLSILADHNFEIGKFIVGNINNDGYLDSNLSTQCLMLGYPAELVEPEHAGSVERVDNALRHLLAKLRRGERPEAFAGMKRREVVARIGAEILGLSFDRVNAMKEDELLRRFIARRLKRDYEDIADLSAPDLLLETIAFRTNATADQVFDVLEVIHDFEPTGIGARDLGECLRLQCEEQGIRNRILYQILDDHLSDLQQKRFREISRAIGVPEDTIVEVFNTLSHLDPRPGRSKSKEEVQYITPDVYVKKIDGKYLYFLNEGDAGRLKVAANYRRLMAQKAKRGTEAARLHAAGVRNGSIAAPTADEKEQIDYASEKYKSAIWLIRNIEKRKSTILRVTEAIMEYQKEFLEKGIEHLRPLTLRDIAERVGMHESTIARVTTKKYVETPRGIFELKYFFSSGLETDDGDAASSRSIKELLTQMIEAEDRRRPLSDQKIADMLRKKGFQIARRTVAKYREQLKILPAKLRKDV